MSVMVLLDDEYVDASLVKESPQLFQRQLEKAKNYSSAKCCCDPLHPIEMVVRQLQAGRILASWPGTLELHAKECPFSSARQVSSDARVEPVAQKTKKPELFYRDGWEFGVAGVAQEQVKIDVDLQWILAELWQSAMLSTWRDGWVRDWAFIRQRLVKAASRMQINAGRLADHLYVIEPFAFHKKHKINEEWGNFIAPMEKQPFNFGAGKGVQPFQTSLVVGELSSARMLNGTWVLKLRSHSADFGLVPEAAAAIDSRLTSKLQQLSFGGQYRPVVMMCVAMDDLGLIHVLDMTLMEVTSRWLPATLKLEKEMLSALIEKGCEVHVSKGHRWGAGVPLLVGRRDPSQSWFAIYSYATAMSPLKLQQYQSKMISDAVNIGRKCLFVGYDHPIQKVLAAL